MNKILLLTLMLAGSAHAADAPATYSNFSARPASAKDESKSIIPGQNAPCLQTRINRSTATATFVLVSNKPVLVYSAWSSSAAVLGEYLVGQDTNTISAGLTLNTEKVAFQVYSSTLPSAAGAFNPTESGLGAVEFNPPLYLEYGLAIAQGGPASAAGVGKAMSSVCWRPADNSWPDKATKGPYTP